MKIRFLVFLAWIFCVNLNAQTDSTTVLKEVRVSDPGLLRHTSTQSVQVFSDSLQGQNRQSLGGFLQFNTPVHIRENGNTGVASASFRGSSAQQTAVIWNGININSGFNGQTDFNIVQFADATELTVKAGGGSVLYGSGAIGGSVHLNTDLKFSPHFNQSILAQYGSFNSKNALYKISASEKNWSFLASARYNQSDNDFKMPNGNKTQNGQYYNTGLNVAAAYRFNPRNSLHFYSHLSQGLHHFALQYPTEIPTRYEHQNLRSILEWNTTYGALQSKARFAYLNESYRYFESPNTLIPSFGELKTAIAKYDGAYRFSPRFLANALLEYQYNEGIGSDIRQSHRNIGSAALQLKYAFENWLFETGVKQEITEVYKSPVLYSAGTKYQWNSWMLTKANWSRNFRIPTYNDLYWVSAGSTDLKPESSYQAEIGQEFSYKKSRLTITAFYNQIKDMIQWIPGNGSLWFPQNVNEVEQYGLEAFVTTSIHSGIGDWNISATYGYTHAENADLKKQLIYVPKHKGTFNLNWNYGHFDANFQSMFTSEVYTRSDNNPRYTLEDFTVLNAGIGYRLLRQPNIHFGVRVLNILDTEYQTMINRYMPGRHYSFVLSINL